MNRGSFALIHGSSVFGKFLTFSGEFCSSLINGDAVSQPEICILRIGSLLDGVNQAPFARQIQGF